MISPSSSFHYTCVLLRAPRTTSGEMLFFVSFLTSSSPEPICSLSSSSLTPRLSADFLHCSVSVFLSELCCVLAEGVGVVRGTRSE